MKSHVIAIQNRNRKAPMTDKKPDLIPPSEQRQAALSKWDDEGGAASRLPEVPFAIPDLTNVELVQLRVRVIALENLVITLLAEASDRQLERIREMAAYISPRPGSAQHPLTTHAATQMLNLVDRARHYRVPHP
jgi:hypothetical protein